MTEKSQPIKKLRTTGIYIAPPLVFFILISVLNMSNPLQSGPLVILVVFALLYTLIVSVLSATVHLLGAAIGMLKPNQAFTLRRVYYVISIVALAPVLFVALNTLGQLDLLETILIAVLVGLGCFYIVRRSEK